MILDVGSGTLQKGVVNADTDRKTKRKAGIELILADGQYLPSVENAFDTVIAFHSLQCVRNANPESARTSSVGCFAGSHFAPACMSPNQSAKRLPLLHRALRTA